LTTQKPQNEKEYFQLTQLNSPVSGCLLTILTCTTLHQEYMLCLFINRKWLGEGKQRRRKDILQSWIHPGLPFTPAHSQCCLLKYQSWLSFYIWKTECRIQQASSSTIVQACLLLTQQPIQFVFHTNSINTTMADFMSVWMTAEYTWVYITESRNDTIRLEVCSQILAQLFFSSAKNCWGFLLSYHSQV